MSQEFFGVNASVDHLGNFEWKNINAGDYVVQVYGGDGQGSFLKSVTLGGRDVSSGFTASGPTTLELVVSTKGGAIEGALSKKKRCGRCSSGCERNCRRCARRKISKARRSLRDGSDRPARSIHHSRPSPRLLHSLRMAGLRRWHLADPAFLKSQEANGTAVQVEEGSDQKIEMKVSAVGEEWR